MNVLGERLRWKENFWYTIFTVPDRQAGKRNCSNTDIILKGTLPIIFTEKL
jgi:hypothetical protein